MNNESKISEAYKTIGEVSKELGLINKKTGLPKTHTLRYWESQFRQIRPIIRAGKRRYYSEKDFEILKKIKFLLKEKGLTINGVKKLLNETEIDSLDDRANLSLYKTNLETASVVKKRIKKISKIVKELKKIK